MSDQTPTDGVPDGAMPMDPFGPMHTTATELFTVFTSMLEVGFDEKQAIALTQTALATHMQLNVMMKRLGGGS